MVTFWTLIILLIVAYLNGLASVVGVRFKLTKKKRLWQNDKGFYLPIHLALPGFYRGLFINVGFAATSLCVATLALPGDSAFSGEEPLVVLAFINLLGSFVTACCVSASLEEELECCKGKFWAVLWTGIAVGVVYFVTGVLLVMYVNAIKLPT